MTARLPGSRLRAGEAGELTVVLPIGPGINTGHLAGQRIPGQYRYVPTPHGARPVLSAYARRWREQAALLVGAAAKEAGWEAPRGDLVIELVQHGTRRDADAGSKLAIDAVAAGLGVDDRRFRRVVLERDRAGAPCLAVRVYAWRAADGRAA